MKVAPSANEGLLTTSNILTVVAVVNRVTPDTTDYGAVVIDRTDTADQHRAVALLFSFHQFGGLDSALQYSLL